MTCRKEAEYGAGTNMFGVGEPLKIEEEKEVLRKAEEAGERLYGNKTGEPVILSNDIEIGITIKNQTIN